MSGPASGRMGAGRLEGIDAWRALLMLGGLLLHGSLWQQPEPLFAAIALVSNSFRMGSFFAISGFLCGVSLLKRPPREWLVRRLVQIGLPTVFGLGVICPLIGAVIDARPAQAHGDASLPFNWYHLWFLLALLGYSPIAVLAHRMDARHRLVERLTAWRGWNARGPDRAPSLLPLMLGVSLTAFALMAASSLAVGALAPVRYVAMLSQCRMMAGYLPLYLFGFALARSAALRHAARKAWRTPVLVVAATGVLYLVWFNRVSPGLAIADRAWADEAVQLVGAALCPPAVFLLIFRSAATVRRTPPLLARLCEASLTMYLVHLPLMVAINIGFATVDWSPYLEFAVTVSVGGLLSYLIHVAVVRPVPLLMLLVNGKIDEPRARAPSMDEARHHLAVRTADLHLRT
jgi:glucan biosynthesis protein C